MSIPWHCPSLELEWSDLSRSCTNAVFPIFAGVLSTALSQDHILGWNISTRIPTPPLALFIVMLPKAYLTSHSSMSGCRWVITLLWFSGSLRSFLHSSSVYLCHLFLNIFCFCWVHIIFLLYCAHLCMKYSLNIQLLSLHSF